MTPESEVYRRLNERLERQRLIVFVGAGVSSQAPTCLPTWWFLQKAVITSLRAPLESLCDRRQVEHWIAQVVARQESRDKPLPPEFVSEIIARRLPRSYSQVLQSLDTSVPNEVHLRLAALARRGFLKAIITTNFDRAIEAAFDALCEPLSVHFRPQDFDALASELGTLGRPQGRCHLLKIHGSAEEPHTMIETLAQRALGFPPATRECLRYLHQFGHWLFLGYSGADLEATPNYLFLHEAPATAGGITWLARDDPRKAVLDAVGAHPASVIARGELPQWMHGVGNDGDVPPAPVIDTEGTRSKAEAALVSRTEAWAAARGPVWCAIVLSDLLQGCGCSTDAADVLRAVERSQTDATRSCAALMDALGSVLRQAGRPEEALRYYRRAIGLFKDLRDAASLRITFANLAAAYYALEAFDKAARSYETSLGIYKEIQDKAGSAAALMGLAALHKRHGDKSDALKWFRQALWACEDSGNEPGRATVLSALSDFYLDEGQNDNAVALLDEALAVRDRLGDLSGRARIQERITQIRSNGSTARISSIPPELPFPVIAETDEEARWTSTRS